MSIIGAQSRYVATENSLTSIMFIYVLSYLDILSHLATKVYIDDGSCNIYFVKFKVITENLWKFLCVEFAPNILVSAQHVAEEAVVDRYRSPSNQSKSRAILVHTVFAPEPLTH